VVSSIDHAYYLDYPQDDEDPHSDPMTPVTDMDTYCSTVGAHMVDYLGDRLLGAEAPLWTELVPQWRVRVKFLDRAIALSEATWSQQCHKHYRNFLQRKRGLELAGYIW
jgi:N-acetyl-beta-hexosaminidase